MLIAPSLLSCDFSKFGEEIRRMDLAGADYMHLDVMDGHFVPNITFGALVIKYVRSFTDKPFDVHLMISEPLRYIDDFCDAGADIITFHVESDSDVNETIDKIHSRNVKAGVVLKPKTPAEAVFECLDKVEMAWDEITRRGLDVIIEADGGIGEGNIALCAEAGVDVAVAGTAVFKAENPAEVIKKLQNN